MGSCRTINPSPHGLRALVTRPRGDAGGLADALAARGIEAIIAPLLEICYRDDPAPALDGVQAVLCTSTNGIAALARLIGERSVPVFAVGEASAARALELGFMRVESAAGTVDDLARLVRRRVDPAAGRLLHVAGSVIAGDLSGDLRAAGFAVDRAVLYEARPAASLGAAAIEVLAARSVDFALFFSPRTAAIFARLVEHAGVAGDLRSVISLAISTAADAALGSLRFRARLVAGRPDQASLLTALDRTIAEL